MVPQHCLVALLILGVPLAAAAQSPIHVDSAQRIRVQLLCPATAPSHACRTGLRRAVLEGHVLRQDHDTLWLAAGRGPLAVSEDSIGALYAFDGLQNHFWAGAGIGILVGGVVGGLIGSTKEFCLLTCSPATGIGVLIGAPAGFLIGGIVGYNTHSDRWRSLGARSITVLPRLDTFGVVLSARF
jgi:hypothetical protein